MEPFTKMSIIKKKYKFGTEDNEFGFELPIGRFDRHRGHSSRNMFRLEK